MRSDVGLKALALLLLIGCESATTTAPAPRPDASHSNVERTDYIGPEACGACHADEYARWSQSLHRVMNAGPEGVIGDFAQTVRYAGGEAIFSKDAAGYAMAVRKGSSTTRYRVTRTIGRRGLQEYVGVEEGHTEEVRLPFGWWPRRAGWFAQPYFDPWLGDESHFDAYAPQREPWAERCPWCHSTYPFAQRIARSNLPHGLGHGMEQWFTAAPGSERLAVGQQVTTGISCESCHLGGRDHAAGGPIHFVPQAAGAGPAVPRKPFAEERRDPEIVNHVCAQCHSGPSPRLSDHTALRNSSEALDLEASPCKGIKCTDCHDPHRADSRADEARALAACTHCHDSLAAPDAAKAHAGHATTSCLDCHMPKLVIGIDHVVRTHRISSPTDATVIAAGGPNACNLCHLDRTIAWTVDELARGWDAKLPRSALAGYPDEPVGETWLASAVPDYRIIAAHAYARSPFAKAMLPALYRGLDDTLAYVRAWTQFAVEDVLGHPIDYDAREPSELRRPRIAKLPR
ncbi:MAG TPA: hypothetical protein VGC41_11765 [Kofleriaceae bacterium]